MLSLWPKNACYGCCEAVYNISEMSNERTQAEKGVMNSLPSHETFRCATQLTYSVVCIIILRSLVYRTVVVNVSGIQQMRRTCRSRCYRLHLNHSVHVHGYLCMCVG